MVNYLSLDTGGTFTTGPGHWADGYQELHNWLRNQIEIVPAASNSRRLFEANLHLLLGQTNKISSRESCTFCLG